MSSPAFYEPARRSRQFDRALEVLYGHLDAACRSKAVALPSITHLSREAGVSRQVMVRALRYCRERGLVHAAGNRGYIIAPGTAAPAPQPGPAVPAIDENPLRGRAREVRDRLAHDIAIQIYTPGSVLPAAKELAHRYDTCRIIVSKALSRLRAQGIVEIAKRRVRVRAPVGTRTRSTVAFVIHHTLSLNPTDASPHAAEFWRAVEQECRERNLRVRLCTERDAKSVIDKTGACGTVLLTSQFSVSDLRAMHHFIRSRGRPLGILDDMGIVPRELGVDAASNALIVRLAVGSAAGKEMGAYLWGLGHRGIALFSLAPDTLHTRDRLSGLRQALRERASADGVTLYAPAVAVTDPFPDERRIRDALYQRVRRFIQRKGGTDTNPLIRLTLWNIIEWERNKLALQPLFERARNDGATAWVGVSDAVALQALHFLRREGLTLPRDISLAGFDNVLETFSHGLTSYSFNATGAVGRLLDHIVQPRKNRPAAHAVYDTPGYLVERETTGPVPRGDAICSAT